MPESPVITRRVFYSGRVQGVGFRATVHGLSQSSPDVAGYVRNLSDGRVEVVAQGREEDVEAFLDDIAARLRHYIQTVDASDLPTVKDVDGFKIRPTA